MRASNGAGTMSLQQPASLELDQRHLHLLIVFQRIDPSDELGHFSFWHHAYLLQQIFPASDRRTESAAQSQAIAGHQMRS